jgi:hypothetical protein
MIGLNPSSWRNKMESKFMTYERKDKNQTTFPCEFEFTFKDTGKKETVTIGSMLELQLFVFDADYLIGHFKGKLPK